MSAHALEQFRAAEVTAAVSFELRGAPGGVNVSGWLLGAPGQGVRGLLPQLTAITGRQPAPPAWADAGLVVGAQGGSDPVDARLKALQDAGVPVAGVWVQDWSGTFPQHRLGTRVWWNWVLDEEQYSRAWIRAKRAQGIRVITYTNPFLASTNGTKGAPPTVSLCAGSTNISTRVV